MFKPKNALISMAVVALLAACGGGGGGGDDPKPNTPSAGQPNGGGTTTPQATSDAKLAQTLKLSGNGVLFPQGTGAGAIVVPISYEDFNSTTPRDAASGNEGGYGSFTDGSNGPNSPLRTFGIRLQNTGGATAESKDVGRLAFELQDQDAGAAQEILRIEIDKVTSSIDATGNASVAVGTGAQVYVYAKNSAGQQTGLVTIPATADMLTVAPTGVDETDVTLNVDAIVAAAAAATTTTGADAAVLGTVKDFTAEKTKPFQVSLNISNANLAKAPATATDPLTPLVGKDIFVGNRTGVSGQGGVTGYYQRPAVAP